MRISDWSSDVGSSDLRSPVAVARFDREHPLAAPDAALHGVTHILLSIPPDDEGDPALASHGGDIVRLAGPTLRWVGYLSTTGVYGDRGGAWVDERSEPGPGSPRARRRLDAERGWQEKGRTDRKSVGEGKRGSVRVDLGGRRNIKKK